ncbi:sulfotransferase family 2 domain-containing protein [Burkholderia savannae]|nr:sulfotransferase family 2 domain-containing protein [Burkholderia savannae]
MSEGRRVKRRSAPSLRRKSLIRRAVQNDSHPGSEMKRTSVNRLMRGPFDSRSRQESVTASRRGFHNMQGSQPVFSGRIIFDHLPKTAGQAVNAWLRSELGRDNVTPNLIGEHRELIRRYGGEYSVISAHIEFEGGRLDPRYQYFTCLREPIDRALSWLFFVVKNHDRGQLPDLWEHARRFIDMHRDDEGHVHAADRLGDVNLDFGHFANVYVEHFANASSVALRSDDEKLAAALETIEQYDVWGLYEEMSDFVAAVALKVGIEVPAQLAKVNVTVARPKVNEVPSALLRRLSALNELDIEFYRLMHERWQRERSLRTTSLVALPDGWHPYEREGSRPYTAPEFTLLSVTREGGGVYTYGQIIRFDLCFSLATDVDCIEIGIDIRDEDKRRVFGATRACPRRLVGPMSAGTYRAQYHLVANFPEGRHTVGFAFVGYGAGERVELGRYEDLASFHVTIPRAMPSVGYTSVPIELDCEWVDSSVFGHVADAAGTLTSDAVLADLVAGDTFNLPVTLYNGSSQDWISPHLDPIRISYRWDDGANLVVSSGEQSSLPSGRLAAGQVIDAEMIVVAPPVPGRYRLVAGLVQERTGWFEQLGFAPFVEDFTVAAESAPRIYHGADARLFSQVGRRAGRTLVSGGRTGFLMYGPYASLSRGRYAVHCDGWRESQGEVWMDVCCDRGERILVRQDVSSDFASPLVDADFELTESVHDLEVRIWVSADAQVTIHSVQIEFRQE